MTWLPPGYKTPQKAGKYLNKFDDGETRIRILSKPIVFWEDFINDVPHRFPIHEKPLTWHNEYGEKHCMAFKIYNYQTKQMEVCTVSQYGIKAGLEKLASSADWGDPLHYDVIITKETKNKKVSYTVTPCPKASVTEAVKNAYKEVSIDLNKLMTNENPFTEGNPTQESELDRKIANPVTKEQAVTSVKDFLDENEVVKPEAPEEEIYPF